MQVTTTPVQQNISSGRWAVAWSGYAGWRETALIGDGITSATACLVTRCSTRQAAEALAAALNAAQPEVLPGSFSVPTFDARRYRKRDYIGRQAWEQNGQRDCDRRIMRSEDDHLHRGMLAD